MPSSPLEITISAEAGGPSSKSMQDDKARPSHIAPVYRSTSSVGGEPEHCWFSSIPIEAHEEPSLVEHATATLINGDNDGAIDFDWARLWVGLSDGEVVSSVATGCPDGTEDAEWLILWDGGADTATGETETG